MTKEQWLAIKNRDQAYDGRFYYALKKSKTLCRPSCSARKCRPENVIIFETLEEGLNAGFTPCPRCHPDQPEWKGSGQKLADHAKAYIEAHYTEKFSLDNIANALFVNRIYLAKCFRQFTGDTPLHYHNAVRLKKAAELLENPELNIDLISSRVGFVTSSHFARVFRSFYGISPTQYRKQYLNSLENDPDEV